ncbi:MAG: PilZ domain-containing protein [Candidatus Aureabacteria bacterium]|nr:PilZ domain-containing protein [Candidatus Auribacterota bacterium]
MKNTERRKYQRVEANIKTSFHPKGENQSYPSLIINMSQGGMLLKSERAFPLDLVLMVKIVKGQFSPKDLFIPAQINRCETIYDGQLYHLAVEIKRNKKDICEAVDKFYFNVLEWKKKDSEERLKN